MSHLQIAIDNDDGNPTDNSEEERGPENLSLNQEINNSKQSSRQYRKATRRQPKTLAFCAESINATQIILRRQHNEFRTPPPSTSTIRSTNPTGILQSTHSTATTSTNTSTNTKQYATISTNTADDRLLRAAMEHTSSTSTLPNKPQPQHPFVQLPHTPIHCLHTVTSTPAYPTKCFVDNPYRKTMLSLLRRVASDPVDHYSPGKPSSTNDRLQIYACYQQHWNPKCNIPVLTITACCNTNLNQPVLTRMDPDHVDVTFMCSTDSQQGRITFRLPIFSTIMTINQSLIMTLGPHHPLPDSLTTWIIRTTENETPLTIIKAWHLSQQGCYTLHNQGIISPHRPYYEAEIHILGLTGLRNMPHAINQHDYHNTIIAMLDSSELGDIGYKKHQITTKPIFPISPPPFIKQTNRALPRITYFPKWYFEGNTIIVPPQDVHQTPTHMDPLFYPPPFNHSLNNCEFPDPTTFQPGNLPYTVPLITPYTTLEDMIALAVRQSPFSDPIITLMSLYNFRRQDLETRFMMAPFIDFLRLKELPEGEHNGLCQYKSHADGIGTGERYLIHKTWLPIHRHPCIKQTDIQKAVHRQLDEPQSTGVLSNEEGRSASFETETVTPILLCNPTRHETT